MKELISIQSELKAPKTQVNRFGGYKYRNFNSIKVRLELHSYRL